MKNTRFFVILTLLTLFMTACNNSISSNSSSVNPIKKKCPDAEIRWVDVLMINDVKYEYHYPDSPEAQVPLLIEVGSEVGKVTYKMADNACHDHVMKNGDATFLSVGTPIYELVGYPQSFVVVSDDRVFVADRNQNAQTASELYPLEGLIKNIHIESTEDGSRLHTFSETSTENFVKEWYTLALEHDLNKLYKDGKFDGERIFLEIELNNGITFRELYWSASNTFHSGVIGNREISEIIHHELSLIEEKSH
jgi:hypothetical protein